MYISTASLFGKQAGPGEDSSMWGEPGMVNCMRTMLNAKSEKPLFFQSSSQFWACWERFMVAVQAVEMLDLRMIRCYRYFLLQLQEEWRLEGRPPMFLWLYDQVLRKQLALRMEVQDPFLMNDTVPTEKNLKLMSITADLLPQYQMRYGYPESHGGSYPPVPPMLVPGSGDILAQRQAFMGNANSVLNDMKTQAERGAGSLVKSTQLQAEFAAKSAAAAEAQAKGQIWKDGGKGSGKSGKSGHKKQHVQNPPGTGRKYFGPGGRVLKGKARKQAFQASAESYKKEKATQWKTGWHN